MIDRIALIVAIIIVSFNLACICIGAKKQRLLHIFGQVGAHAMPEFRRTIHDGSLRAFPASRAELKGLL